MRRIDAANCRMVGQFAMIQAQLALMIGQATTVAEDCDNVGLRSYANQWSMVRLELERLALNMALQESYLVKPTTMG